METHGFNGLNDPQHGHLHRIWEASSDGELLFNQRDGIFLMPSTDASSNTGSMDYIFIDIYLPNGLLLPIQCSVHKTFALLKQDIFEQARKYVFILHNITGQL